MNSLDYINKMMYGVIVILGTGKTFKSGTLYSFLEYCPDLAKRPMAFYRFSDVSIFPPWMNAYLVNEMDEVRPGSLCIIEDANRIFPSRNSWSAMLQEFMGVISHKDILIILTVQNTMNTDIAFFRDQDTVIVHKRMDPTGISYERPELQDSARTGNDVIEEVADVCNVNPLYVSYLPRFSQALILDPPKWYDRRHSHALRDMHIVRSDAVPKGGRT